MSRMTHPGKVLLVLLFVLAMTALTVAQETQQPSQEPSQEPAAGPPKPAARGIPGIDDTTSDNDQNQTPNWQPDNSPVTGLQAPTLGSPELTHSYWVPGFLYGNIAQTQPNASGSGTNWYDQSYIGGQLSLLEVWSRSQLGLNYTGGGGFTTESGQQNGAFQQLAFGDSITLNRWQIQLLDYFSYLPESQFGFASGTGLALPGIPGTLGPAIPSLGLSVIPTQSIYSANGPRYSNASAAQLTYLLTRHASITLGGSYGLLDFTQPGNVNSDQIIGNGGLNYILTAKDSIGVFYRFEAFHFTGEPQALGSHTVGFAYDHKVAQRVALNVFVGPQLNYFRVPISNKTGSTGVAAGLSLSYALQRGSVDLSYFHGVSGGSGILLGAITDTATLSLSHQLSRVWSGSVHFGYSRNGQIVSSTTTSANQTFDDWFVGGGISRPFGRNIQLMASYTARFENSSVPVGLTSSSSYTANMVSVTFQYHTRPFILP